MLTVRHFTKTMPVRARFERNKDLYGFESKYNSDMAWGYLDGEIWLFDESSAIVADDGEDLPEFAKLIPYAPVRRELVEFYEDIKFLKGHWK